MSDINIYYSPEKFGLETVDTVDAGAGFEFDMLALFRRGDNFYIGADSGCSCPIPFEGVGVNDLTEINNLTSLLAEVAAWADSAWSDEDRTERVRLGNEIVLAYQEARKK